MKATIQKLIVVFVLIFNASNASAIFAPVPAPEGKPISVNFGLDPSMYFNNSYRLSHLGASAAMTYNIWKGLAVGVQARGGINDRAIGLFRSASTYTGDIGGDVMVRYLVECCRFYFGVQTVFGYDYTFNSAQTFNQNSFMTLQIGVPVGINFTEKIAVYMMPAVELGLRNATDTGLWGSLVSGSIALGTKINLGGPTSLIVELAPRIDDFANMSGTLGMKTFVGASFDF